MKMKDDAKPKGKRNHDFKNDIKNLVNFHARNLHLDGDLLSKVYKFLDEKIQKSY